MKTVKHLGYIVEYDILNRTIDIQFDPVFGFILVDENNQYIKISKNNRTTTARFKKLETAKNFASALLNKTKQSD